MLTVMTYFRLLFFSYIIGQRDTWNWSLLSFKYLLSIIFEILVNHILHLIDVLDRIMYEKLKIETATDFNFECLQISVLIEHASRQIDVIDCRHVCFALQKCGHVRFTLQ